MFAGRASRIVTALCALIGAMAFVGIIVLSLTDGSEYTEFALAMVFFVSFLIGAYWFIVFGPGRSL
jgi:hypothetical protein